MAASVKVRPYYLDTLISIAAGEGRGGQLFSAWAGTTPDIELKEVLTCVAARESDHAELFAGRVNELGFDCIGPPDEVGDETCAMLSSDASDADKLSCFDAWVKAITAAAKERGGARLSTMVEDPSVDAVTRTLLSWYLDEERDSGRLLTPHFERLRRTGSNGHATSSSGKPVYLGLLNAIAVAEGRGGELLCAWADATDDPELEEVLRFVAARETNHHDVFEARVEELGYGLRETPDRDFTKRLALYASDASDADKIAGGQRSEQAPKKGAKKSSAPTDELEGLEARLCEPEMDTVTRHLLQWFILEERDSGRRLKKAYDEVKEAALA